MVSTDRKSNRKRKMLSTKYNGIEVLGICIISVKYEPYFISASKQDLTKKVLRFLMGNNTTFDSTEDAINYLFYRDHSEFIDFAKGIIKIGKLGPKLIPLPFFSKTPGVMNHEQFPQRCENTELQVQHQQPSTSQNYELSDQAKSSGWTVKDGVALPRDYESSGELQGDNAERIAFYALKEYYETTQDDCLMLHGHHFLHGDNYCEKDIIIVNLTKGYVMYMEVKNNTNLFPKAKEQLFDFRERIQAVFNSIHGMSDSWLYVGACYMNTGLRFVESPENPFVIYGGHHQLQSSLSKIEEKVGQEHEDQWEPQEHLFEFVKVVKVLLFEAQGNPEAPISKVVQSKKISQEIDKQSAPENILFWTPEQLSILQAIDEKYVALMGYYGNGKTILLMQRAHHLLRNETNVVHFYIDQRFDSYVSALEETIRLKFDREKSRIRVKSRPNIVTSKQFKLSDDGVEKTDHVIIDETFILYQNTFIEKVSQMKDQVASLWLALGYINPTIQINSLKTDLQEMDFLCPTLNLCLRNGRDIIKQSLSKVQYDTLGQFPVNTDIASNDGIFKEIPTIQKGPLRALKSALATIPEAMRFLIVIEGYHGYYNQGYSEEEFLYIQTTCPEETFTDFFIESERKKWIEDDKSRSSHLVLMRHNEIELEDCIRGMEFQNVVDVYPVCLRCGIEFTASIVMTRAKATLTTSRYAMDELCHFCSRNAPNVEEVADWNEELLQWELKPGVTDKNVSEDARKTLQNASTLRKQLVYSEALHEQPETSSPQ